jgi:hypothetical protein
MAASAQGPHPRLDFKDFDDPQVFTETEQRAAAENCTNFVLEFGPNNAQIVRDLTKDDFENLLDQDRDEKHPIRWM